MRMFFINISNLWHIYLPLFLVSVLVVALVLVCYAVYNSCISAINEINATYDVSLEISLKEHNEFQLNSDGNVVLINRNNSLIDSSIENIVISNDNIETIEYITNPFYFNIGIICTDKDYIRITESIKNDGAFVGPRSFYFFNNKIKYDIGVTGLSDDSLIQRALNIRNVEITYLEGNDFDSGLILPKDLYNYLGKPNGIIIGWYDAKIIGVSVGEPINGKYLISSEISAYLKELTDTPPISKKIIPVSGFYESEQHDNRIFCNIDNWDKMYKSKCFYEQEHTKLKEETNSIDDIGFSYLKADIVSPDKTEFTIKTLLEAGVDPDDYIIVANDYDYKMALSLINTTERFTVVLFGTSILFGGTVLFLLIMYISRKRQNEIYLRRVLGEDELIITFKITSEFSIVLFVGFVAGIMLSAAIGNSVCGMINYYTYTNVNNIMNNMSELSNLMVNNDVIKMQLMEAIESFREMNLSINYEIPLSAHLYIVPIWMVLSLYIVLRVRRMTKRDLMKREQIV